MSDPRGSIRDTLLDADAIQPLAPPTPASRTPSPRPPPPRTPPPLTPPPPANPEPEADEDGDDPDTLVSRTPDASGVFGQTPLVYVLVHVLDRRLSGTLALRADTGQVARIALREGCVVRVETRAEEGRLGEEAISSGACTPAELEAALAISQRAGSLLGDALIAHVGLAPETIRALLLYQSARRMASLVNLPPQTSYALHLEEGAEAPNEPRAPLDVLLAAVRAWADRPRIHGTIRHLGNQPIRLHPGADVRELMTLPAERRALELLAQGEVSLGTLYRSVGAGLSSLVYVLAVTRQILLRDEPRPPMGASAPTATPSESRGQTPIVVVGHEHAAGADSLARAPTQPEIDLARIRRTTAAYPIRPTASAGASHSAPPPPAPPMPSEWPHDPAEVPAPVPVIRPTLPSARPPPDVPSIPPVAAAVPTSAFRGAVAPSDGNARASAPPPPRKPSPPPFAPHADPSAGAPPPARAPAAPPVGPPAPAVAPTASANDLDVFAVVDAALARHDFPTADEHAVRLKRTAPDDPRHAALFAWVGAHSGEENAVPEAVRALTRILEDHPKCERALFYRGTLLKRVGKDKTALRDFVTILYDDPKHVPALNAVRDLRKKK